MGYCVETVEGQFRLDKENYDAAYRALCELNAHDELKTGGQWPESLSKPEGSRSLSDNPNKWFAWMDWNYDESCGSVREILEAVGFDVDEDDRGICGIHYEYQKSGSEEEFLRSLGPYVAAGSYLVFQGEEGDRWGFKFDGERMIDCYASTVLTPSRPLAPPPSQVAVEAAKAALGAGPKPGGGAPPHL